MINQQFMLTGATSRKLYEKFAKDAPIYDFHCHLSAKDIYEDKEFSDISSLWLGHDHYKWRAMRYAGIAEEFITGSRTGVEKFKAWAGTCERLIGSPLYHWANMELNTYFGIQEVLKERNAEEIFELCNRKIIKDSLSPVKMIRSSKVKLICTTDDPVDDLKYHKLLKEKYSPLTEIPNLPDEEQNLPNGKLNLTKETQAPDFKVLPTFRPDKSFQITKAEYLEYVSQLGASCNSAIHSYKELLAALRQRIRYFAEVGCLLADHSLESLTYLDTTTEEVGEIFARRMKGEPVSQEDAEKFKGHLLVELASEYRSMNWVMQLHIGAYRNTNSVKYHELGADTGYDIMNDFNVVDPLTKILNNMELKGGLPKTILYTLNSKDNLVLSSLPHCFSEDGVPGKIQFGPAWWLCDHKEGILSHLKSIASQGMLADFVGMLTDSRSFLSYVRHDYFRRLLCSYLGELVDNREFEYDEEILGKITSGICYKNIVNYLGLEE